MKLKHLQLHKEDVLTAIPTLPLVLGFSESPPPDFSMEELKKDQVALRSLLSKHGAILFRNCAIQTVTDFHRLLAALGIESCNTNHYYGEVIRAGTGSHTMEPTHMPSDFVIAPHNESAFWYEQPEFIAFYCEKIRGKYGQTPIFDCAKITQCISKELREKLSKSIVINEYVYDSLDATEEILKKQKRNCWQSAYQTNDRSIVEAILDARNDVEYNWRPQGELHIRIESKVFGTHPKSKEICFQASRAFDFHNVRYMLQHFAKEQLPYLKYLSAMGVTNIGSLLSEYNWVEHQRYAWKTSIQNLHLSKTEIKEITNAIFKNMTVFRWKTGDVLLIDNIKTAHGRLNIDGDRTLHVFISTYIDQKIIYPSLSKGY